VEQHKAQLQAQEGEVLELQDNLLVVQVVMVEQVLLLQ